MNYVINPFLRKTFFLLFALTFTLALGAQEQYEAVKFDGKNDITFSPPSSLKLEDEGTIELLFRVANSGEEKRGTPLPVSTEARTKSGFLGRILGRKASSTKKPIPVNRPQAINIDTIGAQTLITHATRRGTHFTVYLNQSATRIGLYDGSSFKSTVFNFNDGKYHHVALATANGRTAVIIDETVVDTLDITYGELVDAPLVLGSAGKGILPFKGDLLTFRIWKKALDVSDMDELKLYGQPPVSSTLYPHLVLYSQFGQVRKSIYQANSTVLRSALIGALGNSTTTDMLQPGEYYSGITIDTSGGCTSGIGLYKASANGATDTVRFGSDSSVSGNLTGDTIDFRSDEFLTGVAATNSGGCLKSIRLTTNLQTYPLVGKIVDDRWASTAKLAQLPRGALLVGIEVETGPNLDSSAVLFYGLRLLYTMNGEIGLLDVGNWAVSGQTAPVRDDDVARRLGFVNESDGGVHLHGNYTATPVVKLKFDPLRDSLTLLIDLPAQAVTRDSIVYAKVLPPYTFSYDQYRQCFWSKDNKVKLTFLEENSFELQVDTGGVFPLAANIYNYQGDYEGPSRDKNEWGGTFTLNQRPALVDFNFRSYNAARINPFNYQISTGTDKFVFAMPEDDSYDYYYSTADKIIPYGLYFANDRESISRAKSTTVTSMKEHQSSWAVNLGMNMGLAGMALSESGAFQHSSSTMRTTKMLHTSSMAHEVKYALVLDRSRMKLDPDFRSEILRMRDELLLFGNPTSESITPGKPNYLRFIETYGTHYPYAVTYGGMAYQNIAVSDTALKSTVSNGASFTRQASATLEGVTLGTDIGGSYSSESGSAASDVEELKTAYTVGGDISFGEGGAGWNLPNGDEVPVLLDLRMITELLSPLYFDDPFIWTDLREGLERALIAYDTSHHISDNPWMVIPSLQSVEVDILSFDNPESGDLDDSGEWVANLKLAATGQTDTSRVTFNTTADGLDDGTSLPINQSFKFLKEMTSKDTIVLTFSGDITDLDTVGDDDVCKPTSPSPPTIVIMGDDPLSGEWQTNTLQLSDGSTDNEAFGTITYRYRMVPKTPRTDPPPPTTTKKK